MERGTIIITPSPWGESGGGQNNHLESYSYKAEEIGEFNSKEKTFDVVIVDIQSGSINPETLINRVNDIEQLNNIKLVLITGTGKKGDAKYFEKLGFSAYISKPVDIELLNDCLKSVACQTTTNSCDCITSHSIITRHSIAETKKHHKKILVVEDNETNMIVAKTFLSKLGYHADEAFNGKEGVDKVRSTHYDIIFMDCQMPVMDGFTATKMIRESEGLGCHIPIVAMTANAMKGDREKCIEAGMDDFISKPVDPEHLAQTIKKFFSINQWNEISSNTNNVNCLVGRQEEILRDTLEKQELFIENLNSLSKDVLPFDKAAMVERFGGDEESVELILESFIEEASEILNSLENAVKVGESETIRALSHALKGSAANVHAIPLKDAALEMERAAKSGSLKQIEFLPIMDKIKKEFKIFVEFTACL